MPAKRSAGKGKKPGGKLTGKRTAFCREYVLNKGNGRAAYKAVYACARMSDASIDVAASQLRHEPAVAAEIERLQEEGRQAFRIELAEVVQQLFRMFTFDVGELFDGAGPRSVKDISEDLRRCIQAVKITTMEPVKEVDADGNMFEREVIKTEFRLADKAGIARDLMKHLGGYLADHQQRGGKAGAAALDPALISEEQLGEMSDEQLAELAAMAPPAEELEGGAG